MPITNQERRQLRSLYRKIKKELDPVVVKMAQGQPIPRFMPQVVATQNTLGLTWEMARLECPDADEFFVAETTARVAAHMITAVEPNRRVEMAQVVIAGIKRILEIPE